MNYKTALVAGLIFAAFLRFFGYRFSNDLFVYLALPGVMVAEEVPFVPGAAVEIAVNAVFYSAVLWAASRLLRGFQRSAR